MCRRITGSDRSLPGRRRQVNARAGAPGTPGRNASLQGYRHIFDTGIFWVAEIDGRLAAICCGIVRDRLWFLSGFWTRPELQGQRIGGPLLRRVYQAGADAGAETFFVWSSSTPTAMASYMKLGMLPGTQILRFGGRPDRLPDVPAGHSTQPLSIAAAADLDRRVRATGREEDHRFWQETCGYPAQLVLYDGQPVGYSYPHDGAVGAVAWTDPEHGPAVLALALREAAGQAEQVGLIATGENHLAIRTALGAGLRLISFSHLLTNRPVGRGEQYLPSGPLLY